MARTTRTMTITLNSALTNEMWAKFKEEIEQAACDYAAACEDDTYELRVSSITSTEN